MTAMSTASRAKAERPVYPTWIRSGRIVMFWSLAVGIAVLGGVATIIWLPAIVICALAIPFFYIALVLTWTSHRLGPQVMMCRARFTSC